jgi:hypothetical protein
VKLNNRSIVFVFVWVAITKCPSQINTISSHAHFPFNVVYKRMREGHAGNAWGIFIRGGKMWLSKWNWSGFNGGAIDGAI